MEKTIYFLGVDVSKATLDIALVHEGTFVMEQRIANQGKDIRSFLKQIKMQLNLSWDQMLVCMEHTGIYNYVMLEVLTKQKIKVCLEPALQIKQSQGMTRGKTDQVDARRIAQYAYKNRKELKIWKPQRSILQKLQALLSLRDRLIKARVQLKTPIQESIGYVDINISRSLKKSSQYALKGIDKDLKQLEKEIDELVQADQKINTQFQQATSVPSIGRITALNIIVTTGEFERITESKRFACHVGVAPFEHSSGSSIRGRTRVSKMANMTMKKLLHLAAMSAIQCCQEIRVFYLRKVAEGKNKMSVINAVRNKLISRVFACINQQRMYEKTYQNALA